MSVPCKFILSKRTFSVYLGRDGSCRCRRCGVVLNVGDRVVSRGYGGQKNVVYHVKCWEDMFI